MTKATLADWLEQLEQRAPESRIELGLDRVRAVYERLDLDLSGAAIVTVAGTNGKGSTVAYLERIYCAAGFQTFAYSSPHLLDFRERLRLNSELAAEVAVVAALERVEQARDHVSLTYFEHITLAGLVLAARAGVEVLILEVGLGGRLDAVNVLDADVAILTSIGLDHTEWLGRTRLKVGREKAGIARQGKPLIVGEKRLPSGLLDELKQTGADVLLAGRDLRWRSGATGFGLTIDGQRFDLPSPGLPGRWQLANAACAVAAVTRLQSRLPVEAAVMGRALAATRLPGRFQRVSEAPEVILDVAHNAAAARVLAAQLDPVAGRTTAVFSALADKNVAAIGRAMQAHVDHWLVAPLQGDRACSAEYLAGVLGPVAVPGTVETVESISQACRLARDRAEPQDRLIVFGSFRAVAEAWPTFKTPQ